MRRLETAEGAARVVLREPYHWVTSVAATALVLFVVGCATPTDRLAAGASTATPVLVHMPSTPIEPGNASQITALGAVRTSDEVKAVAWSPEGKRLATGAD